MSYLKAIIMIGMTTHFSGLEVEGKVYGRGTTDMKGGNVSLLLALEAITSLNIPLKGDLIFQSVIEEESGGAEH